MKDQYIGDINDFFKYSILEKIKKELNKNILIAWMLTKSEGMNIDYKELEKYNKPLYEKLQGIIASNKRHINSIESYYEDYVYQSTFMEKTKRKNYFNEIKEKAEKCECDLIFFDPDIGISSDSMNTNKRDNKYIYMDEIKEFFNTGKDLLIYQHFRRQKWEKYLSELKNYVEKNIEGVFIVPIKTKNVMFMYFSHKNIIEKMREIFGSWDNEIEIFN